MAYRVNNPDGIRTMFNGRFYPNGATIGPHAMPPRLWESLLAQGAVVADTSNEPLPEQPESPLEYEAEPDMSTVATSTMGKLSDVVPAKMLPVLAEINVKSTNDLLEASESTLTSIKGVGKATVKKWKEAAK